MKEVKVEDAVGMVLCHDLTRIVPGEFKGCAFQKGHIIQQEDIEALLDMGKRHVYVDVYKRQVPISWRTELRL